MMERKRVYRCPKCKSIMMHTEEGTEECASRFDCIDCGAYAVFFEEVQKK